MAATRDMAAGADAAKVADDDLHGLLPLVRVLLIQFFDHFFSSSTMVPIFSPITARWMFWGSARAKIITGM